jgi:hypothetical protein
MTDFVGKTAYHTTSGKDIIFGSVEAQSFRDDWLWLRIEWEDNLSDLAPWCKAVNVGTCDKSDLIERIQKV